MPGEPGKLEGGNGNKVDSSSRGNKRSTAQGRFRTYVVPNGKEPQPSDGDNTHDQISEIDRYAVSRVLAYERKHGREPREMSHTHPGYDVESTEADGKTVRYIEVKGVSDSWGSLGVGLTKTEFEKAATLGGRYWLYVVERAAEEDFEIYCINGPARRMNQFFYDNGWQFLSEEGKRGIHGYD